MDNETTQLFDALQEDWDSTEANTGRSWPDNGTYECALCGLHFGPGTFREGRGDEAPQHKSLVVQFEYEVLNDASKPEPYKFRGSVYNLPLKRNEVQGANYQEQARIALSRVKECILKILPSASGNLAEDVQAIQKMIAEKEVVLKVRVGQNRRGYQYESIEELMD